MDEQCPLWPPEVSLISIQYSVIGGKRKMVFRGLPRACWEFLFFRHQGKMGMVFGVIDSPQPQHTVLAKKASYEIRR
jgi:hypothetical protein